MFARLALAVFAISYPLSAHADRQTQCIEDFERAQRTRKSGKLLQARGEFRACADPSCPSMLRKDCTDALAQLGTAIPSVRVKLEDEKGNELGGFSLEIDGARVEVGAEPIELDPGRHLLVFSSDGKSVEKTVTLRSGDVAVPVIAALSAPEQAPDAPAAPSRSGPPALAYVLGGVALVGAAGFVGFGLAGRSTERCKGSCSEDEIDTLHRQYLLADVSLGLALISGGVAGWLFFGDKGEPESARTRPWVGVAPSRSGAVVGGGLMF
ncbi:MAG: hypothetical protein IPM35_38175 [Myxococcales bacterium]|nr:hypothetical protein [Myxococcales bacterium]